jgi:hypothetical protein
MKIRIIKSKIQHNKRKAKRQNLLNIRKKKEREHKVEEETTRKIR